MSPRVATRHCISTPVRNSLKVCLAATVRELELCFPPYAFQKVFSSWAVTFRQPLNEFFEPIIFFDPMGYNSPWSEREIRPFLIKQKE